MERDEIQNNDSDEDSRDVNFYVGNNSVIVGHILKYFNNSELMKLRLVCKIWKNAAEHILKNKIRILCTDIPYTDQIRGITQPEVILPLIGIELEPNAEFITEIHESVTRIIEDRLSLREFQVASFEQLIFSQIAIFPRVSRIHLHRFEFKWYEFETLMDENNISNISDILHVGEKIKCLLLFINGDVATINNNDFILPMCSIGGVFSSFPSLNLYRGIAILGENVHAASFPLFDKEITRDANNSYVEKLKDYKINGKKSVAFVFTAGNHHECSFSEFKTSFPNVPILYFVLSFVFGLNYLPGVKEEQEFFTSEDSKILGMFIVLWYN